MTDWRDTVSLLMEYDAPKDKITGLDKSISLEIQSFLDNDKVHKYFALCRQIFLILVNAK